MTLISDLHQQWLKDPEYQAAYEAQRPEFEIMFDAKNMQALGISENLTRRSITSTNFKHLDI
jgi:hypothetical protein